MVRANDRCIFLHRQTRSAAPHLELRNRLSRTDEHLLDARSIGGGGALALIRMAFEK